MSGRSSGCTLRLVLGLDPRIGQLTVEPDLYEGLPVKGFFAFYTIAASNIVVRTDRSFGLAGLLDGIDLLRCERAPGASTYIRQLHDGLPQSCMHDPNDRRDGFTLFTGVAKGANRILDFPSPRLRGRSARSSIDRVGSSLRQAALLMIAPSGTTPVST